MADINDVIPTAPPRFLGRLAVKMPESASPKATKEGFEDDDIKEFVAVMFVMHYLGITDPDLLSVAAKHAGAANNDAFQALAKESLITYMAVENKLKEITNDLESKFPIAILNQIRSAKRWRYTQHATHVCTGESPRDKQRLKRRTSPKALKTMTRLWMLQHRHDMCSVMLKPCRTVALSAPLAPDTYYKVTRELNASRFIDVFFRSVKEMLTGKGPMELALLVSL